MAAVLCGYAKEFFRWLWFPPKFKGAPSEDDYELTIKDFGDRWKFLIGPIGLLAMSFLGDQWLAVVAPGWPRVLLVGGIVGVVLPIAFRVICYWPKPEKMANAAPTAGQILGPQGVAISAAPRKPLVPLVDRLFLWRFSLFYFAISLAYVSVYGATGHAIPSVFLYVHSATTHYKFLDESDFIVVPASDGGLIAMFGLDCSKDPGLPEKAVIEITLDMSSRALYRLGDPSAEINAAQSFDASEMAQPKGSNPDFYRSLSLTKVDRRQKTTILIRLRPGKSAKPAPPYADIKRGLKIEIRKWNGIPLAG